MGYKELFYSKMHFEPIAKEEPEQASQFVKHKISATQSDVSLKKTSVLSQHCFILISEYWVFVFGLLIVWLVGCFFLNKAIFSSLIGYF